jgi:hypothetical protein
VSVYGGKITGSIELAESVTRRIEARLGPRGSLPSPGTTAISVRKWEDFPGLGDKVPAAAECAAREMCYTIEDYLRRRTNISQWVPRGGLGRHNENLPHLARLARLFPDGSGDSSSLDAYQKHIEREMDALLAKC